MWKLNSAIDSLAPRRKVQLKKSVKIVKDEKARIMYKEAADAKEKAIKFNDIE